MMKPEDQNKVAISRTFLLTLVAGGFALGVFIGAGMHNLFSPFPGGRGYATPESPDGAFSFIRSSTTSKDAEGNRPSRELKPFRYKVSALIEQAVHDDDAEAVSVYFRELNNGNWFGIGERERFAPENLLKLPLMIAYFKWSETNPLVLRKSVTYRGKAGAAENQEGTAAGELEPGKAYTVNDLIFRMIVRHDDAAYALLSANLPRGRLDKIYRELDADYDPRRQEQTLSLSAYAAFYRVLFNASYLSEEMSEKALRYLTRSVVRTGMAAGVPPNISIAGRRGERILETARDDETPALRQVYEFGLIYHDNRPFLLGFVARGRDEEQLAAVIRNLTRLIYEEVDQQS